MTKVIKFGGSSLASAEQLEKVLGIVKTDRTRRFVIVSAPGKRHADDTKVTDALIAYHAAYKAGKSVAKEQDWVVERYRDIAEGLGLKDEDVLRDIAYNIHELASLEKTGNDFLYDTFLAAGENNNAKLIAAYFRENGIPARYVHPRDAGITVSREPGNARLLTNSYEKINYLNQLTEAGETLVIPGFFGVTEKDEICTFSRGGSDITGSIIAAGVKADLYENFTDVDGIFACNPKIIDNPAPIHEVTYREMRELAYSGFSVLHDEALVPAFRAHIPIVIKNTNNPKHPGTRITTIHEENYAPVVGIASDDGFTTLNLSKYLLNREVGFGRRVLSILEEMGVRWEHMPTGIDDISIIIRSRFLTPDIEKAILSRLAETLHPDELYFEHDLSIIMLVGENMKAHIGVTARAAKALSDSHVNIKMLTQGASECAVMFVVKNKDEESAVKALYQTFFW
ncbi:MAG: aspartate kinase [Streptococcaceae bacterium]|jgi:aspartate kinase|nr:aspartate kinase [Streptococcaceae bacterium]